MTWQEELKESVRDVRELPFFPRLAEDEQKKLCNVSAHFPMSVTSYYLSLMDVMDENDPLRKMAIPSLSEASPSGSFDTSGEADNTVLDGLQHKYDQTAMVLSSNQCAMYCRHCFRKRIVGLTNDEIAQRFYKICDYVRAHEEISNVLVSGGDALLNSNERLDHVLTLLTDIPHLDLIRIASRVPVVFPSRILKDEALLRLLAKHTGKKQLVLVTHFNHPRELAPQAEEAVRRIRHLGIPVKNQTVLLRGVNDDPYVLGTLMRRLVRVGVDPYYIFQCRPVRGVKSQFQVPLLKGADIVEQARAMQNGLGKTFRYCMSHVTGKLEILGTVRPGEILLKYHEAEDPANLGRLFTRHIAPGQSWLEDLVPMGTGCIVG